MIVVWGLDLSTSSSVVSPGIIHGSFARVRQSKKALFTFLAVRWDSHLGISSGSLLRVDFPED